MASVGAKAQIYDTVVRTETTIEDENSSSGVAKKVGKKVAPNQLGKKPIKRPPKKVAVKPKAPIIKSQSHHSVSSSSSKSKKTTKTKVTYEYKPAKLSIPPQQPPVVNYYDHRSWTTNHNYFGDTSATYEGPPDTLKYDLLRDGTLVPHTDSVALPPVDTCNRLDSSWKHKENLHCKGHRDWVLWHWKDKQKYKLRNCVETDNRDSVLRVRLWFILGTAALVAFEDYACTQNYWLPRSSSSNGNSGNNNNNGNDPAVIDTGDTNHHGTGNKPSPKPDVISRDETKSQKTNPAQPVKLYKVQPVTFGYSLKATFTFPIGTGQPFINILKHGFFNPKIQPLVYIKR